MARQALPTKIDRERARLPRSYEQAKVALASCASIDECQEWVDKMAALASYARQAEDETLLKTAMRIQGRAVRRAGELLKEFDARGGDRSKTEGAHGFAPPASQRQVAEQAGMSEHQQLQAVRVASIPPAAFEAAIEAEKPATVTALAEAGKKRRKTDARSSGDTDEAAAARATARPMADFLPPQEADKALHETARYLWGGLFSPPPGIRACLKEAMARASPEDVRLIVAAADFLNELKEAAK